jgi:hypothetical protein
MKEEKILQNSELEKSLRHWNLVRELNTRLAKEKTEELMPKTEEDKRRQLHVGEYLSLLLFEMWNPAIKSMRALCKASRLDRIQKEICHAPVSLGSFSEMQAVIDPALLERVFESAVKDLQARAPQIPDPRMAQVAQMCHHAAAIDSTLLEALNRMLWAQWNNQHQAVRLHVKLSVWSELPMEARVTDGKVSERAVLKEMAKPGNFFIGDRYYSGNYRLLEQLSEAGVHFVFRLRGDSVLQQESPMALRPEDEAAGVFAQCWANLGGKDNGPRLRIVRIRSTGEEVRLVTNLPEEEWPAEWIALLYRRRWVIELFFRWLKCLLNCRHFLCESERGVRTQLYLALIGAVLVALWTGKRPNKRQIELIQLYFQGWATQEEVMRFLHEPPPKKKPKVTLAGYRPK